MRSSLVASLLLLLSLLMISIVQGIRLGKGFGSVGQHKISETSSMTKTSKGDDEVGVVVICKDGQCSSGKNRKLGITMSTRPIAPTPPANSIAKTKDEEGRQKESDGDKKEESLTNSMPISGKREESHHDDLYSDTLDIAEMDYSPARRKPPIHN